MVCVVACVFLSFFFFSHSPEKTQTSFGQKSVYLPVNVSQSRHNCVRAAVLSTSCLMFYALLSESDDTAADSPLSQQPLISIARPFNLLSSSIYTLLLPSLPLLCLLSPNSRSLFFLTAELQRFGFILFLFFIRFLPRCSFNAHQSCLSSFLMPLLFILLSSGMARRHFKMCNNLLDQENYKLLDEKP